MGDFNDRCINLDSDHKQSELGNRFKILLQNNNLDQLINEPTHIAATTLNQCIQTAPWQIMDTFDNINDSCYAFTDVHEFNS